MHIMPSFSMLRNTSQAVSFGIQKIGHILLKTLGNGSICPGNNGSLIPPSLSSAIASKVSLFFMFFPPFVTLWFSCNLLPHASPAAYAVKIFLQLQNFTLEYAKVKVVTSRPKNSVGRTDFL